MAKKFHSGGVNKSQAIRDLLKTDPKIKAKDAVTTLGAEGITIDPSLFYFTKGRMKGRRGRRKKAQEMVEKVSVTMGNKGPGSTSDVIATILKVKHLATDVGGLKKLKALVEALE